MRTVMHTPRLVLLTVVMLALLAVVAAPALAGGSTPTKELQLAPETQGFIDSMFTATGGLGKRPNPVPFTVGAAAKARAARLSLPSSYSLVDLSRVTSVKDQGAYSTCWAFANMGAIESKLRPGQTWDFSEDNLVTRSGFGPFGTSAYDWGGWDLMAIAYLARWAGPVNEADDPYVSPTPPTTNRVRKHVQGAIMIPGRTSSTDNDLIKQLVVANGALSVGMYWDDDAYNNMSTGYACHYLPSTSGENHGVCIVGWDDSFAAANFAGSVDGTPPGDGAFLVRNSWGSGWGNNGYFWVSYYDMSFARDQGLDYGGCTSYSKVSSTGNYRRQYSYDKLGATDRVGYGDTRIWGANRFKAKATERISAVGFYALEAGTTWQVRAGRTWSTLKLRASGTASLPGYTTVKFNSPLTVYKGKAFIVAVRMVSPTEVYPFAIEAATYSWQGGAAAGAGQSYVRHGDSGSWTDITSVSGFEETNVCIKAFAIRR